MKMFDEIFARWNWKQLISCPGRFIFAAGTSALTAAEICRSDIETTRLTSIMATDEILVVKFETGGGLISYVKSDNKFLHTLCDEEGLRRKLTQLNLTVK